MIIVSVQTSANFQASHEVKTVVLGWEIHSVCELLLVNKHFTLSLTVKGSILSLLFVLYVSSSYVLIHLVFFLLCTFSTVCCFVCWESISGKPVSVWTCCHLLARGTADVEYCSTADICVLLFCSDYLCLPLSSFLFQCLNTLYNHRFRG